MAVGNLEFIKSGSASTVTRFDLTDCFNDTYDVFQILISKLDVANTNSFLTLQFLDTSDTVISGSNYDTANLRMPSFTTFIEDRFTNEGNIRYLAQLHTTSADGLGLSINVFNPYSSSYTFITNQTSGQASTGLIGNKSIAVLKDTQTCTGISITAENSTGSIFTNGIDNIEVSVYGVK
jgi:hypothetical protein